VGVELANNNPLRYKKETTISWISSRHIWPVPEKGSGVTKGVGTWPHGTVAKGYWKVNVPNLSGMRADIPVMDRDIR
jgi:hypothetical protein